MSIAMFPAYASARYDQTILLSGWIFMGCENKSMICVGRGSEP